MTRAPSSRPECMTQLKHRWASSMSCCSKSLTRFNSAPTIQMIRKCRRLSVYWASATPRKCEKSAQLPMAQLAFANSDLAFQGNHLFMGNFYGINIYDISNPAKPTLLTSMICPGGQGDPVGLQEPAVHVGGDAERPARLRHSGISAGASAATAGQEKNPPPPPAQKDRFRGVRIFDITDIKNPKQVAAVQTCRGSHTHTLVVDPNDKKNVYIYVSGTSFVRQAEELAGCSGEQPDKDPNTALFRIDVIKVPLAAPQDAKVVSSPRLFMDPRTGAINALNSGGTHGKDGPEKPSDTNQCHDITVYSAARVGGRRLLGKWNPAGHQRSGESEASGRGKRSELCVLALGLVFERWEKSRVHR